MFFKYKESANVVVLRGEEEISRKNKDYLSKEYYLIIVSCDEDLSLWCSYLNSHKGETYFFIGDSESLLQAMELAIQSPNKNRVYHLPS